MENSNPKAQIVEEIKKSTNILVTVSHNPSVDALAAALGFSLMLNKLDKHATAVFSGATPPAIQFLKPDKTFAGTVSSLRDFIIALDKEKADRLRYKVEGDVVRIYITPYKTTITKDDLDFSEGDFNVDMIIALGVDRQADLDSAISAHGRILHDATVATINLDSKKSTLGTMDWFDEKASSLCEMLMSLSEALQPNLLDEQIATALLTGIVAATDRFSNEHTSPRVMTMSAQLMAAGADQKLIAEELEGDQTVPVESFEEKPEITENPQEESPKKDDNALTIERSVNDELIEQAKAVASGGRGTSRKEPPADDKPADDDQPTDDDDTSGSEGGVLEIENESDHADDEADILPQPQASGSALEELHEQLRAQTEQSAGESPLPYADWKEPANQSDTSQDTSSEQQPRPAQAPAVITHTSGPVGYEGPASRPGSRSINDGNVPPEPKAVDIFDYEMTGPIPTAGQPPIADVLSQGAPPLAKAPTVDPLVAPEATSPQAPPVEETPVAEPSAPAIEDITALAPDIESSRKAVDQAFTAVVSPQPTIPQESIVPPQNVAPAQPVTNPVYPDLPAIPMPPPPPMPDFSQLPQPPAPAPGIISSNVPPSLAGNNNTHVIDTNVPNLNVPPQDRVQGFGNPNSPYTPPTTPPVAPPAPGQFQIPGR